ncbi:MAG: FAD-dependent oxidoreductase [Verrucomicrobia bacterium]|nr:FAD-dependent oxidoreductase [Verrucomicrobiota bacterium]
MAKPAIEYDAVVIGAGAAGLTAASELQAQGLNIVVLEARQKAGGRIDTDYAFASYPIERGAEFIHGENVCTWQLVRRQQLRTLPAMDNDDALFIDALGHFLPLPEFSRRPEGESLQYMSSRHPGIYQLAENWVNSGKPDTSVDSLLEACGVKLYPGLYPLINHSFQGLHAAGLQRLGVYGLVETSYADDGTMNFRIVEGYNRLFRDHNLSIRFSDPVQTVAWDKTGARIKTKAGLVFETYKAIITLPLAQLQKEAVRFEPALPPNKTEAIRRLGAGHITKLVLRFGERFWPSDMERFATEKCTGFWWRPGWGRPDEEPILTAYAGAELADRLSRSGRHDAVQIALDDLTSLFGKQAKDQFQNAILANWQMEPHIGMGYSFCPAGATGFRALLSCPVDNVLFFAGEATSVTRAATVHGAIESGLRAAHEVVKNER